MTTPDNFPFPSQYVLVGADAAHKEQVFRIDVGKDRRYGTIITLVGESLGGRGKIGPWVQPAFETAISRGVFSAPIEDGYISVPVLPDNFQGPKNTISYYFDMPVVASEGIHSAHDFSNTNSGFGDY